LIEEPLRAVDLACDPALSDRLVRDVHGQSGGLALLGAALEDLYAVGAATGGLTLAHYEQELGGLAGILEHRAERGFAVLAADFGLERTVAEVLRDAERWDKAGRPDDFLPVPGVRRDIRYRLQKAGLWEGVRADETAAYFLAEDDPQELQDLTRRAFAQRASDPEPLRPALRLLCCLAAPGRTWETTQALGEWIAAQEPAHHGRTASCPAAPVQSCRLGRRRRPNKQLGTRGR